MNEYYKKGFNDDMSTVDDHLESLFYIALTEMEQQTMYKPNFDEKQKDWIRYQIGEWYLKWRHKLINYEQKTHRLGFAKEELKNILCDEIDEWVESIRSLYGNNYE